MTDTVGTMVVGSSGNFFGYIEGVLPGSSITENAVGDRTTTAIGENRGNNTSFFRVVTGVDVGLERTFESVSANKVTFEFEDNILAEFTSPFMEYTFTGLFGVPNSGSVGYSIEGPAYTLTGPVSTSSIAPIFSVTTTQSVATFETAGFLDNRLDYVTTLQTDDVLLVQTFDATKLYTVTVDKMARTVALSTGLVIA